MKTNLAFEEIILILSKLGKGINDFSRQKFQEDVYQEIVTTGELGKDALEAARRLDKRYKYSIVPGRLTEKEEEIDLD